ncbi:hypothetical protein YB2330_000418 [Saitoella coloradoensis]
MTSTQSGTTILHDRTESSFLPQHQQNSLPDEARELLEQVDELKFFLLTAPAGWQKEQVIRRFLLPTGEYVSCVLWKELFYITGTDIVRIITCRFAAFGRSIVNAKKFEEGIFSDLRNLRPPQCAVLEQPKSAFLDLLYKNNCIRTQKKQKVFFWFSVPHDRLFIDALERDLKREARGEDASTEATTEPAISFNYDEKIGLYEQMIRATTEEDDEGYEELRRCHHAGMRRTYGQQNGGGHSERFTPSPSPEQGNPQAYAESAAFTASPQPRMDPSAYQQQYTTPRIGYVPITPQTLQAPTFAVPSVRAQSHFHMEQSPVPLYSEFGSVEPQYPRMSAPPTYMRSCSFTPEAQYSFQDLSVRLPEQERFFASPATTTPRRTTFPFNASPSEASPFTTRPMERVTSVPPQVTMVQPTSMSRSSSVGLGLSIPSQLPFATPTAQTGLSLNGLHPHTRSGASAMQRRRTFSPYERSATPMIDVDGTPTKGYMCRFNCGKIFRKYDQLKAHMLSHMHEKPYVCDVCERPFSRQDNLLQHMRSHERSPQPVMAQSVSSAYLAPPPVPNFEPSSHTAEVRQEQFVGASAYDGSPYPHIQDAASDLVSLGSGDGLATSVNDSAAVSGWDANTMPPDGCFTRSPGVEYYSLGRRPETAGYDALELREAARSVVTAAQDGGHVV